MMPGFCVSIKRVISLSGPACGMPATAGLQHFRGRSPVSMLKRVSFAISYLQSRLEGIYKRLLSY